MLLDVVVARQPGEVRPVAHLPFHVGHAGGAFAMPEGPGEIVGVQGRDVADGAVMDAADGFAHRRVVAPAKACPHRQPGFARRDGQGGDTPDSGSIDGHRLFAEDVLAGADGRLQVHGAEMRRRAQEHDIDAAADHLSIGVEADELPGGRHVDLVGEVGPGSQLFQAAGDAILEGVADGPELAVAVGQHRLGGRPGAAPAGADQADLERLVIAVGVRERRHMGQGCRCRDGRGGFQKGATIGRRGGTHVMSPAKRMSETGESFLCSLPTTYGREK